MSTSLLINQVPVTAAASDGVPYELGMKFQVNQPGYIDAIRFYKSPGDTSKHTGRIWSAAGAQLASVVFANETASGWQQQSLLTRVRVQPGVTYVVSVNTPNIFPITYGAFAQAVSSGGITALAGANGVFGVAGSFPTGYFNSSNYFRDVVFTADVAAVPMSVTKEALAWDSTSADVRAALLELSRRRPGKRQIVC